ncbi:MAG: cyclic nucleotide-binding domain-containing protein, partial [Lachnospiraceae bacterium]|nr:cyclic nucleotide-binding domain-containing protein [Lachnospiraceae bacterium]
MAAQLFPAGKQIIKAGDRVETIWYIQSGTVLVSAEGISFRISKGNMIGILDLSRDEHTCNYTVEEDAQLVPFLTIQTLTPTFFAAHPDHTIHLVNAINVQAREVLNQFDRLRKQAQILYQYLPKFYETYCTICESHHVIIKELPGLDALAPLKLSEEINPLITQFYVGFQALMKDATLREYFRKANILPGYLYQTAALQDTILGMLPEILDYLRASAALLCNDSKIDLYELLTSLSTRIGPELTASSGLHNTLENAFKLMQQQSGLGLQPDLIAARVEEYQNSLAHLAQLSGTAPADDDAPAAAVETPKASSAEMAKELANATDIILEFAGMDAKFSASFKAHVKAYKDLEERDSTEQDVTKLRRALTAEYNQLYKEAFLKCLPDKPGGTPLPVPTILQMFFNYGFVDAELAGAAASSSLYEMVGTYQDSPQNRIHTMYHWLMMIYQGKREPSINEFGDDFEKSIANQLASKEIDKARSKIMMADQHLKVVYELENLFPSSTKITNGHLLTFCPLLSEHQMIQTPAEMILHADTILNTISKLKSVDYQIFYHDVMKVLSKTDNVHDYLHVEIQPDIILTPVIGSRGAMWQECSGRNVHTPARFLLPLFMPEDLTKVLYQVCAEFRWEICKRIQGSHWNDVTDPSLTSLYCDYMQFYRKNNDLSPEMKEKIKLQLTKSKNNYRTAFVSDYVIYVMYEGAGSPRLNKVAREILFMQCPFKKEICDGLESNPLYSDLLHRRKVKTG